MPLIVSPAEAAALIAANARQRAQALEPAPRRARMAEKASRGLGWAAATVAPASGPWQPPTLAVYARASAAWAGASRAERRAGIALEAGWLVRQLRRDLGPSG